MPGRCPKFVDLKSLAYLLLSVGIFLAPVPAHSINAYPVGEAIEGKAYDETTKTWIKHNLSLWVGINSTGEEVVLFSADSGIGTADVWIPYASGELAQIERLLTTAREWVNIARSNKADTSKVLGCFPDAQHLICEQDGRPHGSKQIGLRFYATDGGQSSEVIFDVADQGSQYNRATLHFGPSEIDQLIGTLRKVEHSFGKARETAQKQNLFKSP